MSLCSFFSTNKPDQPVETAHQSVARDLDNVGTGISNLRVFPQDHLLFVAKCVFSLTRHNRPKRSLLSSSRQTPHKECI